LAAAAALAATLMICFGAWTRFGPARPTVDPPLPSMASVAPKGFVPTESARRAFHQTDPWTVAVLSRVVDAGSSTTPLKAGGVVRKGRFVLDQGVVQLEFLSGANLVVEAPADLDLLSATEVYCRRGKLRARVPTPAKGFAIETVTNRAIDLGTEFAVAVDDAASTEVHVLDGEVKLLSKNAPSRAELLLLLGDAYRVDSNGNGKAMAADGTRFISAEQLIRLSEEDSEARYAVWRDFSRVVAARENVLVYYSFEGYSPWERVLRQDGPRRESSPGGAIVGCRWTEGRWPNKGGLEFKGTEDRVRLYIPGDYESVSLSCWLRIDGFDRWLSGLLLTDGHDVGEVHWQFTETGQLLLGVKADSERSQEYLTDVVLRPHDVGRWVHLACVYNHQTEEVIHYLDGRRVEALPIHKHTVLRFGAAEIGNWAPEDFIDHRIRSLNGRLDEFILFDGALTDAEILEIYQGGQPSS
jgi:hypothetical protein